MVSAVIHLTNALTSLATCYALFLGFHGVISGERFYLSETSFFSLAVIGEVELSLVTIAVAAFFDGHYQNRPTNRPQSAYVAAYL